MLPCFLAKVEDCILICFNLQGYANLYRSLLRFTSMGSMECKRLLYTLNTANIDSFSLRHPYSQMIESDMTGFWRFLDKNGYPYHTEVQLYKSLEYLFRNIDDSALTGQQKEAVQQLTCIIENLGYRFQKAHGVEIDSDSTVYGKCIYGLVTGEFEPKVCLAFG